MCTLETFIELDLKDLSLKNELITQIENDRKEMEDGNSPKFNKYFENKDKFSNLGQVHIDLMKTEKTLKRFHGSLYTVIAASKFKKLLSNKAKQEIIQETT